MADAFTICWFRRDLRLDDNTALFHALSSGQAVIPLFIFDREILDELPQNDARVDFIHRRIMELQAQLTAMGSSMLVYYGKPEEVWPKILADYPVVAVYTNHDYEPYAKERDEQIGEFLAGQGFPL